MFLRWGVVSTSPNTQLKDHLLSAVRDCLFNIFAATLRTGGRSSIRNLRTRHAVVKGTHLHGPLNYMPQSNKYLRMTIQVLCPLYQCSEETFSQNGSPNRICKKWCKLGREGVLHLKHFVFHFNNCCSNHATYVTFFDSPVYIQINTTTCPLNHTPNLNKMSNPLIS